MSTFNFYDKIFSFQYNYCNSPLQMIVALLVVLCMRATSPNPVPGLISPKIAVLTLPGNVMKTISYHDHERVSRSVARSSLVLDNIVSFPMGEDNKTHYISEIFQKVLI